LDGLKDGKLDSDGIKDSSLDSDGINDGLLVDSDGINVAHLPMILPSRGGKCTNTIFHTRVVSSVVDAFPQHECCVLVGIYLYRCRTPQDCSHICPGHSRLCHSHINVIQFVQRRTGLHHSGGCSGPARPLLLVSSLVAEIVTDEDSTTRSKLSYSKAELIAAGRMAEEERQYLPKKPGTLGSKKPDNGELPLDHPPIKKLSDPIHYVKNYNSELYKLVYLLKKKSLTCKADTMRLSCDLAYTVAQHTPGFGKEDCTFKKFETADEASFEHGWDNHEHCGKWCQAKTRTEEEKIQKKGKFRDKIKNKKEYQQQMKVKKKYLSTIRLRRCYHQFCNNKTEKLHRLVVNDFLPKRSYFCCTICGRARTYLAMSVDTLGIEEYYQELYEELGISMSSVTARYYQQHDQKRKRDRNYAKSPARKKKRARRNLDQIQKAGNAEAENKEQGHTYQSQMTAPKVLRGTEAETNDGV
jgi:hypothetical protein